MTWMSALPLIAVLALVLTVPGFLAGIVGGLKVEWATVLAPVTSLGILAAAISVSNVLKISWNLVPVVIATVIVCVLLGIARYAGRVLAVRFADSQRGADGSAAAGADDRAERAGEAELAGQLGQGGEEGDRSSDDRWRVVWILVGAAIAMLGTAIAVKRGMGTIDALQQTYDAPFHVNAVDHVMQVGRVSPGIVASISATANPGAAYPPLFHAIASLGAIVTGTNAIAACNALGLVQSAICWPLSLAAMPLALAPRSRRLLLYTPVLGALCQAFPYQLLDFGVLWPYGLGVAVVPGIVALIVIVLRAAPEPDPRRVPVLVAIVIGLLGAYALRLAHPSVFISAACFGLIILGVRGATRLARWARRSPLGVAALAGSILVVAAAYHLLYKVLLSTDAFGPVLRFDWPARMTASQALGQAIVMRSRPPSEAIIWAMGVALVIGLVSVWRAQHSRWLVVAYAALVALYMLAAGVDGGVSEELTGFWYNDPFRLMGIIPVVGVPLAAYGIVAAQNWLATFWANSWLGGRARQVAWIAVLVVFAASLPGRLGLGAGQAIVAHGYGVNDLGQMLVSPEKRVFLTSLSQYVSKDGAIAGNPWDGTIYAGVLTGRRILFPHFASSDEPDRLLVRKQMKDYYNDPAVCAAVKRLKVELVFEDADPLRTWPPDWRVFPGLNGVDGAPGLQLVAAENGWRAYKVLPCQG